MNRSVILAVAAAGTLSVGLLAADFGHVAPDAAAQTTPAGSPAPELPGSKTL